MLQISSHLRRPGRVVAIVVALIVGLSTSSAVLAPLAHGNTYSEQQGSRGANTFTDYHNASGMGTKVPAAAWVDVSCKVYDPTIASVNPDGYWYRIDSSPWNESYYAAANTFMNGDPWGGPYTHNTDFSIPDCGTSPPSPPPPPAAPATVTLGQGGAASSGYWYSISLRGFAAGTTVSISCRDSVDPSGFRTFNLNTDAGGNADTSDNCRSGDGPDHWVVAGGIESNHVSWRGGGSTSGGGSGGQAPITHTPKPPTTPQDIHASDPCMYFTNGGTSGSHSIFAGYETNYDRTASLYQVCEGYGAPDGVGYSFGMKCGLIAAAATLAGPPYSYTANGFCDRAGFLVNIANKDVGSVLGDYGCSVFSDLLATGAGVLAAGAAAESGPGAVAVGVGTYRVLASFLTFSCSALLDHGAFDFGYNQETKHEHDIAIDVLTKGKCIRLRSVFGFLQWSAAEC